LQPISGSGIESATTNGIAQFRPDWPRVKCKIVWDEVDVYDGSRR
jgi:hypothetical protein